MQSAYEILSDPQERAWYDTHRHDILRAGVESGERYEHNIRVTTAEEVLQMFSKFNRRVEFSDDSTGFYGALREFFDRLAREEEAACAWSGVGLAKYPSFGHKNEDYEDGVRAFYATWNSFATKKAFSWKDVYNYTEAPDRQIRRLMEKENKRLREEGAREFNDAVRSLVAFVRKRDPRFVSNKQSEEERQKVLHDAAVAQAARSRAANQAKLDAEAVPAWMMTGVSDANETADEEWAETSPVKVDIDCVVCNKTFKSEKQYETHEKSKKHIQAVKQVQRQMRREDRDIGLDLQDKGHDPSNMSGTGSEASNGWHEAGATQPRSESISSSREQSEAWSVDMDKDLDKSQDDLHLIPNGSDIGSVSDEDYAPRREVEQRLSRQEQVNIERSSSVQEPEADRTDDSVRSDGETTKQPKLGKAKEKRAKKAAQKPAQVGSESSSCAVCFEDFPSRTQLFRHLKESAHGRPMAKATKGGKGKQ